MLRTLFSFFGTITRQEYIAVALAGALFKYAIDSTISSHVFHRGWSPLNYIVPLGLSVTDLANGDIRFLTVMVAVSIPFAWIGTAVTVKRFRTIGWPPWTVAFFFVPIANVVSFAVAAAWPRNKVTNDQASRRWLERVVPHDRLGAALLATVITGGFSVGLVALGANALGTYGWGLFAGIPFAQGAISALIVGAHRRPNIVECVVVAALSVALTSLLLLAVALEGAICIAMATPLAMSFAILGAAFGYGILAGPRVSGGGLIGLVVCALVAPGTMGVESSVRRPVPIYEVETSVLVNAPPSTVWKSVVSFPDLPPPTELMFRLGIAYPMRARITGAGVGAVRYCEFSTGSFVEPVTSWEPGKRLAFNVVRSAEPMRELSPYGSIDTRHLRGYMVSRRGEFVLIRMPGKRTLLVGRTWYQHRLWPPAYWAIFADAIVHSIHLRVLDHVKALAESSRS